MERLIRMNRFFYLLAGGLFLCLLIALPKNTNASATDNAALQTLFENATDNETIVLEEKNYSLSGYIELPKAGIRGHRDASKYVED